MSEDLQPLVGRCADCSIVTELRMLKEEMEFTRARLERMKRVEQAAEAYIAEVRQMEEAARQYLVGLYTEESAHPGLIALSKALREAEEELESRSGDP